ncbi:2-methylcitrate dehydratase PrpD [Loktanella atrilutea]|uniref:2-methylcitrate dehydratase PrpD n=1 Tax=Loktanella atrilutea TaxID=366533 RepID=A0A1M4USD2_LOKAT|nr:MmgE/PrpD family protein [Loktanella atrilutea]SHE59626.1 2-methylcitrate dehydratase PrpD [Loktanella atrilutea]
MTVTETLARWAAAPVDLPDTMRASVGASLFDWASVGLAGRSEPVAQRSRAAALEEGGTQAGLFGGGTATARAAALVNGATSHALDYDDTHFLHIGHPSVAVTPAALAVAQWKGATGAAFLDALALGLEASCRIGDWLGRAHYEAGFHQTGTAGAFGATVAAGRLLGLDADRMTHALALTATRAAGLKSQFGTMGKPLNAGFAAEVGVTCAMLAAQGVTSTHDAIAGSQGFGPTHAGMARDQAFDGLGQVWVFPDVSYKFHACCHGLHAMLEAAGRLRNAVSADAIEAITIHTHPRWLAVCNQPSPDTGLGAKFSYRLTAAMALAGVDTAALDTYTDAMTQRPDLVALRDRVTVVADTALTDMQARVSVTTRDGTQDAFHDLMATGSAAALRQRLQDKSASLLGSAVAEPLWQAVEGLGAAPDSAALTGLIFA